VHEFVGAIGADDIGAHAIEYAMHHWRVFPLRGKVPAIPNPHPKNSAERLTCKGECGQPGHGVLDATDDVATVAHWWGGRYRDANIGARVPDAAVVIDVDPRHGGLESARELARRHGGWPKTLTTLSGRGDGGAHLFYRRPAGQLSSARLGAGIDIKTSAGYTVMAPSIHPATGKRYRRVDRPVAPCPNWLVELLRQPERPAGGPRPIFRYAGTSIADQFGAGTSWGDVLIPHGWHCLDADPDADGARWLHPAATSACSATVRNGCLFVYSPNTPFDVTEPSNPNGYTRFRAYAVLNHGGDLRAAAAHLRGPQP
jgi:hypothetical protein